LLKVLVLIIALFFHGVIGIGIGNTFLAWYCYWILQYFLPVLLTTLLPFWRQMLLPLRVTSVEIFLERIMDRPLGAVAYSVTVWVIIGARVGLLFCRLQKLWDAWSPLITPCLPPFSPLPPDCRPGRCAPSPSLCHILSCRK